MYFYIFIFSLFTYLVLYHTINLVVNLIILCCGKKLKLKLKMHNFEK